MISTKKSLVTSVVSLLLCFAMLLGTTLAWFTDAVTSEGNIIQAGDLDANMYWSDKLLPTNSENLIAEGWYNAEDTKLKFKAPPRRKWAKTSGLLSNPTVSTL